FSLLLLIASRVSYKYLVTSCGSLERIATTLATLVTVSFAFGFFVKSDSIGIALFIFFVPSLISLVMILYEYRMDDGHFYPEGGLKFRTVLWLYILLAIVTAPREVIDVIDVDNVLAVKYCSRISLLKAIVTPLMLVFSQNELLDCILSGCFGISINFDTLVECEENGVLQKDNIYQPPLRSYGSFRTMTPVLEEEYSNELDEEISENFEKVYRDGELETVVET
uniref:Uncharacterized protein n=1 Tax=Clytia hemisphaerica TaxID=252671 RepID=A0A7M5WQQ4_9CNID